MKKKKILFACHDVIGKKISGVGIRYLKLAQCLAKAGFEVTLSSPEIEKGFKIAKLELVSCPTSKALRRQLLQSDIIVATILSLKNIRAALKANKILIFDLYDPIIFEQEEHLKNTFFLKRKIKLAHIKNHLKILFLVGDYFLCASDIQKTLWQDFLKQVGRRGDLISIVPFGLEESLSLKRKEVFIRIKNIFQKDKIVLWGGGIYDWLDPLAVIEAMKEVSQKRQDVKLVFLSTSHPNPNLPKMNMVQKAVDLAKKLNLLNRFVFFLHGWIPYDEREDYFFQADLGVCAHFDTNETKYAFRTRALDYLKANCPIVSTKGDFFSQLVEKQQLGVVCDFQNPKEFASAVLKLLEDKNFYQRCRENILKIKPKFYWSNVAQPLISLCQKSKVQPKRLNLFWPSLKYYFFTLMDKISEG